MSTDPREIEGSPERAADRGREEDLGFPVPGSKPSLGDPEVVSGLMSEFASAIVDLRKRYNQDKLDFQKAHMGVFDLAREYGGVVMGRDRRYQSLPWNDPSRLGRRIKMAVPACDGVEDPGELLFLAVAVSLLDLAVEHEDGRMSDDDVKSKVQEALADAAGLILGVR